jgi:hypothetical protein
VAKNLASYFGYFICSKSNPISKKSPDLVTLVGNNLFSKVLNLLACNGRESTGSTYLG